MASNIRGERLPTARQRERVARGRSETETLAIADRRPRGYASATSRMLRISILRIVIAVSAGATFLLSNRAWLTARGYPHLPAFDGLAQPPQVLALVLFGLMLLALLATAAGKFLRPALSVALAILAIWLVLDQNRWQPYVVFFAVALICLLLYARGGDTSTSLAPFRILLCCTYIYSGLHKFNYRHVTHDFGAFLQPLLQNVGVDVPARVLSAGALFAGAFELTMGILLVFARTRRIAIIGLTLMHAFILLTLGPLGANYNSVVWPWNIASIAALWLVFRDDGRSSRQWLDGATRATRLVSYVVLVLFGVMPLFSFAGLWAPSLSFQLYSGKQPAATLAVTRRSHLPPVAARVTDSNNQLEVFEWAMEELNISPAMEQEAILTVAQRVCRETSDRALKLAWAEAPAVRERGRWVHHYTFAGPECRPVEVTKVRDPDY